MLIGYFHSSLNGSICRTPNGLFDGVFCILTQIWRMWWARWHKLSSQENCVGATPEFCYT